MRSAWESSHGITQPAGFYRNTEMGFNVVHEQVLMSALNNNNKKKTQTTKKHNNRNAARESLSHVHPVVSLGCVSTLLWSTSSKITEPENMQKRVKTMPRFSLSVPWGCSAHAFFCIISVQGFLFPVLEVLALPGCSSLFAQEDSTSFSARCFGVPR